MNNINGTAPAKQKKQQQSSASFLERVFQLSARGTNIARELRGGFVTFLSMVYILVLNPIILSGKDSTGAYLGGGAEPNIVAIAAGTALVAGVMTFLMGAIANFPLALAAGLGLNSVVAYALVQIPGMTWADGMGIIVIEGIVIVLLVLTGLREAIFRAVPKFLRIAISVGIGMFISLIGFSNAGLVKGNKAGPTLLNFGNAGSIDTWPLFVFILGLFLTFLLMARRVPGAILIGMTSTTIFGFILEAVLHLGAVSEENPGGWISSVPAINGPLVQTPHFETLGEFSLVGPFQKLGVITVVVLAFTVMLADFFDTMGTMVAVAAEGKLLDAEGNPPRTRSILMIDSVAAIAGGLGGVSSNTSFVESTSGVADGARTGLASVFTGIFFLLATFLAPLVALVPSEAAAPALVAVGVLMMMQVAEIKWDDFSVAVPAFLTIAFMPFGYSITVGIGVGFIVYVIMESVMGRIRKVHPLMWVVAGLFVIYFLNGPIQRMLLG
ncbi:AGZA family xanthine/uracil permease-like MFS transporter [Arcanobacterium hippocoleae]|uniref:AGZA family xanthine/uracil permease-like MFS transporter n=1 Tax=Arcanobacterium hippocoleae TaxID=149017 RepID=A0ABU1T3J5_9ACTO|nr:AGZA family xanthine/uracil permease-like MFS transporter [Arcanobacterium hippocoleae]